MKIVHCLDHYMPVHMGGVEVYVNALAASQKKAGHDVSLLIPHFEHYRPGLYAGHYVYEGVDVYEYREPSDPRDRGFLSGRKEPAGLMNFKETLHTLQPDAVHFHEITRSIGIGLPHVKLAKETGATVILTMHLSFYTCNTNLLVRNDKLCSGEIREFDCSVCCQKTRYHLPASVSWPLVSGAMLVSRTGLLSAVPDGKLRTILSFPLIIRRIKEELLELAASVDKVVTLTQWYKKILITNGVEAGKIAVVPQAPAVDGSVPPRRTDWTPAAPLKIIFIGRIYPLKGVHHLIEAVEGFTREQVIVDIYGKDDGDAYGRQCKEQGASVEAVRFKGLLEREKVLDTLNQYDILCLPSISSEMSPLVIQEAFAAGIPALVSHSYGNLEQVEHDVNGLVFDFNSPASLRVQIERLIKEPQLLTRLRSHVQPPGDFQRISNTYLQLYKR